MDFNKISLTNKYIFGITIMLLVIIVVTNVLVFAYAVFVKLSTNVLDETAYNSESAIHALSTTIFNFGYFYPFWRVFL